LSRIEVSKCWIARSACPANSQAALEKATANRAHDQANLQNAELNFGRDAALLPNHLAVTQQQYDTDKATVAQLKAKVAADDAAIETAHLNLGYTELRAPFAGPIGRSLVHEGTLIHHRMAMQAKASRRSLVDARRRIRLPWI
jgi:multidrug efflux pump subunit AcrA (membrane-fusion protein)